MLDLQRILATTGIVLLFIGSFCPMIDGSGNIEAKSFFSWGGDWDGPALIVMAIISVVFVFKYQYRWTLPIGLVSLYLVYRFCLDFYQVRQASLSRGGEFAAAVQGIGLSWGLWVMAAGAVLLTVSSLLPCQAKARSDHSRLEQT